MEFFASLMFDSTRIILQTFYMSIEPIVFTLQRLRLNLERMSVFALLLKSSQAVLPKDNVIAHHNSKCSHRQRSRLPTLVVSTSYQEGESGFEARRSVVSCFIAHASPCNKSISGLRV